MRRSIRTAKVLARFTLPRRVLARYIATSEEHLAMEFNTPEALREYLHEHPGADKSKHTVKKPGGEGSPKGEEPKGESKKDDSKGEPKGDSGSSSKPKKMFSDEEMSMPKLVTQKTGNPEELMGAAQKAHEEQLDWLNHGKGLEKALGAKVVRGDKGEEVDPASIDGPVIMIGPLKKMVRIREKADADYGGDLSKVGDIVRATVAVDSMDDIDDVMSKLRESGLKLARKPTDRFQNPTEVGYRDIMMNVVYPNGHIGELQLHLKSIAQAKAKMHKHYEVTRTITDAAKKEGRTTLTDEEQATIERENAIQREAYEAAYAKGMKKPSKKEASLAQRVLRRIAKETKFYDYEGLPAIWEFKKFPQKFTVKGDKVVYELGDFFMKAVPISESDYKKLREDFDKTLKK